MTAPRARVPLAWRNLAENPRRLGASVAGVAFAVVLMFLEIGFRNALLDNMVAVVEHLDGDLFLTHRGRYILSQPSPLPARRLDLAAGVPGVAEARPFYLLVHPRIRWRNPRTGDTRAIRVLAFRPEDDLLDIREVRTSHAAWAADNTTLADDRSKPVVYGQFRPGEVSELAGRRIAVVGLFSLGTDFRANGTLLLSEANFLRVVPERNPGDLGDRLVDLGVIRADPDVNLVDLRRRLAARLPADCLVLTKLELMRKEQHFWARVTPVGVVFDIGVAMGFVVGLAVCYQILFAEIHDRLGQFATLKAMGYPNRRLLGVLMGEALILAALGFAAGALVSLGLYAWLGQLTGMTLAWKWEQSVLILGITIVMCTVAASLAGRRLRTVDPAELFG